LKPSAPNAFSISWFSFTFDGAACFAAASRPPSISAFS
jgi:hypothetical protein